MNRESQTALPIVGVMGSGSSADPGRCRELGRCTEVALAVQYGRPLVAYLRNRGEIPQLPETVTVASTLEDLQAFVLAALGRTP